MMGSKSVTGLSKDTYICGKRYAGILFGAEPYFGFGYTKDVRCICGYLADDLKKRGFSGSSIRTSVVESLIMHDGEIYAITMNSAYRLGSLQLQHFISSPVWSQEITKLLAQAILGVTFINKEDSNASN